MPRHKRVEIDRLRGSSDCRRPKASSRLASSAPSWEASCASSRISRCSLVPEPPLEHLEIAGDHREKIVEVMGDAPGELADRLHLLRLAQLLLHLDACREVADEAGEDGSAADA